MKTLNDKLCEQLRQIAGGHRRLRMLAADEIERQSAENSRLEVLVHRLQATSMEQAKSGEKLQEKLDMAEGVIEELERVSTVPAPDGINDRGSDEYANPERDGDRQ